MNFTNPGRPKSHHSTEILSVRVQENIKQTLGMNPSEMIIFD